MSRLPRLYTNNDGHASKGKAHETEETQSPRCVSRKPRADSAPKVDRHAALVQPESLAARLRSLRSADNVSIGSQDYEPSDLHVTASWADVQKIVSGIRWLKRGYLPYGMLVGLIGEPKCGKSAVALGGVVGPIITGCNWFNSLEAPEPGYVVWCDTERRAAINLNRAIKWGLPLDRIKTPYLDDPLRVIDLNSKEDIDRLYNVVCKHKAKLIVVDSFRGSHKGDENNSSIAESLQNLGRVAEQTQAANLLIHHTRKLGEDEEVTANSGRGSNAFLAMVACQWAIDVPDPNSKWRRLQVLARTSASAPQPIGFCVPDTGVEFGSAPVNAHVKKPKGWRCRGAGRKRMKPDEVYKRRRTWRQKPSTARSRHSDPPQGSDQQLRNRETKAKTSGWQNCRAGVATAVARGRGN